MSETTTNDKPSDSADKPVVNRRAGYGAVYDRAYRYASKGWTLAGGEGAELCARIDTQAQTIATQGERIRALETVIAAAYAHCQRLEHHSATQTLEGAAAGIVPPYFLIPQAEYQRIADMARAGNGHPGYHEVPNG